jgi:signal transduction histidine kinase
MYNKHKRLTKNIMKYLLASTLSVIALAIFMSQSVLAVTYGGGGYSDCTYQNGCPTVNNPPSTPAPINPTPPTVVTPPSTNPPTTIIVNVISPSAENPVSSVKASVEIDISTINSQTNEPIDLDNIGEVALFVDEVFVKKVNADIDGTVKIEWDIIDYPGNNLTIVVYDKDGNALAKEEEEVTFVEGIESIISAEKAKRQEAFSENQNNNQEAVAGVTESSQRPTALSQILGSVGSLGDIGKISDPIELSKPVETIVTTFPLWIFIVLFVLALRLIWQSSREVIATHKMQAILAREKLINEEKSNFISLASHYINTPFTLINSAVEMFASTDNVATNMLTGLQKSVSELGETLKRLISNARNASEPINEESISVGSISLRPVYKSPAFIIPTVGVAVVILIVNIILQVVTTISINAIEIMIQLIILGSVSVFFALTVRSHNLKKQERIATNQLMEQRQTLDASRNSFIEQAALELRAKTDNVVGYSAPLKNFSSYKYLDNGIKQFQSSIYKFEMAKNVTIGAIAVNTINTISVNELIDGFINKYNNQIVSKKIFVDNNNQNINVSQNLLLFGFAIESIISNAIKFTGENGKITIETHEQNGITTISVNDTGIGINDEKLKHLFEPFSRGTSVHTYDYEGMGFSLYLSNLICERLNGKLSLDSVEGKGTHVEISVPTNLVN